MNFREVDMDKKVAGLVGAVSALATMTAAEAARAREATEILNPRSYAELLQPIPNAVALLIAADALSAARAKGEAGQDPNVKLAQYEYEYGYYHHHHHHHHHRRWWYHHHHHHHHHRWYYYHHHHHHHHHHHDWYPD
jgi:hypothetical protein